MKNVSDRSVKENQNTHTLCSISPPPRNGAVYKIMWTNMVESYNPQMTVHGAQKMPFPFRVTRASIYTHTHTHTHNLHFIFALFRGRNGYVIRTVPVVL